MGLPDPSYSLPRAATSALHVAGGGVPVPVDPRWLAQQLLEPLLEGAASAWRPFPNSR